MKSQRVQDVCKLQPARARRCTAGVGGELMHQGPGVVGKGKAALKGGAGLGIQHTFMQGICIKA